MAFEKPNYTQTPNLFLDRHLPEIKSLAELKVTLVVLRNTLGWHAKETELTITRLIAMTGLSNRHVIRGTTLALERGTIKRRSLKTATGQTYAYEANIESEAVTKGHKARRGVSDQRSPQKVTKPPAVFNISLKKEKESELTYAISELKDPDTIPGLRNQLSIYTHVSFDDVYSDWYAKYEPRGGIGRATGSRCTVAQYATSIENHFRKWERNAESRNGQKRGESAPSEHPTWMASPKPENYFNEMYADFKTE